MGEPDPGVVANDNGELAATPSECCIASAPWKLAIIQPIRHQSHPGTARRRAMIDSAGMVARYPAGRKRGKPVGASTIRSWIKAYEERGLAGLIRRRRSDANTRRVLFSRRLDDVLAGAGFLPAAIQGFGVALFHLIDMQWREGTSGWRTVQTAIAPYVRQLIDKTGIVADDDALRLACLLPRGLIEAGRFECPPSSSDNIADSALWSAFFRKSAVIRDNAERSLEAVLALEALAVDGRLGRGVIETVQAETGFSKSYLYKIWAKVAEVPRADWLPVLAANYKPGGRKVDISDEAWTLFLSTLKHGVRRLPLARAYRDVAALAKLNGWAWPCYGTVRNRWEALPAGEKALIRNDP